jgi:hypothetical protein
MRCAADQLGQGRLCRSNFIEQFGVAVQHFEQLDERQRRFGFTVLVSRECVDATAEYLSSLALGSSSLKRY